MISPGSHRLVRLVAGCALAGATLCAPAGAGADGARATTLELRAAGSLDPLADGSGTAPALAASLFEPPPGRTSTWLVQFVAPVDAAARARVQAAGGRVLGFVPRRALAVALSPASSADLAGLDGVRWAGPLAPELKLDPALRDVLARAAGAPLRVLVELVPGEDAEAFVTAVLARAPHGSVEAEHTHAGRVDRPSRVTLLVSPSHARGALAALARSEAVGFVFHHPAPELHNDDVVWTGQSYDRALGPLEADAATVGGGPPSTATVWARGLFGEGQLVAVADTGLTLESCAWDDPAASVAVQQATPPASLVTDAGHRKIAALNGVTSDSLAHFDTFRHGTHVASTVAGALSPAAGGGPPGHNPGDGIAPAARIVFEDIGGPLDENCLSTLSVPSLEALLRQEYEAGARISTNSWSVGNAGPGEVDVTVWDHEEFLTVFSAGNRGTLGVNGMAQHKNGLTVGAGENWDDTHGGPFGPLDPENLAAFSSVGPSTDGRIKPDIVAPGYVVYSNRQPTTYTTDPELCSGAVPGTDVCTPSFGGCYVTFTDQTCELVPMLGTSMAAPAVAGFAALARQYFTDGYYPSGAAVATDAVEPSAALLRAVLLNGARNMNGRRIERRGAEPVDYGPIDEAPSAQQGWGRVMLDDALYFDGDSRRLVAVDVRNATGLGQGQQASVELEVADPSEPLKVTLTWTDPPALSYSGVALVNDLDLVLLAPDGTTYAGNRFTPDDPAVAGDKISQPDPPDRDALNTVEGIVVPSPQPGTWTASVQATNVPGFDGVDTQGYALVATGAFEPAGEGGGGPGDGGGRGGGGCPGRIDTGRVGSGGGETATLEASTPCSPSAGRGAQSSRPAARGERR